MKRYFNSTHENMKCIPPPPLKETHYNYTPPPPPPPPQEGYVYTPPPPRGPELSLLQHETKTEERTLFTRRAPHSCLKYPAEDFRIT